MGAREVLSTISNWMTGLRRAVMANRMHAGALFAVAGFLSFTLVIMILEAVGHFSGTLRAILLGSWIVSALAALGLGIVWPLLKYTVFAPSHQQLAGEYAERLPHVKDRVLNALQLLDKVEGANREGYSTDMILAAGRDVAEELQPINPKELPDRKPVKFGQKLALGSVGVTVLFLLVAGNSLLSAGERVLKPGEEFAPPAAFTLSLKPGEVELVRGDSLMVEIYVVGDAPEEVILERIESGKSASEPVALKTNARTPPSLPASTGEKTVSAPPLTPPQAGGKVSYVYRGITAPFTYWARAGDVTSEKYKVSVKELPTVKFLSLRVQPPAYTGLEEQVLEENVGDVAAVVGTKVKLQLAATKSLKTARIEFTKPEDENPKAETPPSPPAKAEGSLQLTVEGSRAIGEFEVKESGYYRIRLVDNEGLENRDPILYRITARKDESPMISIKQPSQDIDIAANVKVAVVTEALDDFGFTRLNLRYYRTSTFDAPESREDESNYQTRALEYDQPEPGKAVAEYVWDMTPLDLLPEDQVMFFAEVWDNDRISGPKRARSETRVLRFPSMAEIFDEQEKQAEMQQVSLEDILKESKELREKVDEAVEEFKSNPEMSWERKQELEQLMQRQSQMNEMLNQISEAMEKAAEQMEQRAMFSPEVMDKIQKIQEMVRDVLTPEMREALKKMAEAMKQPTEEEMRRAMENMQKNQDLFEQMLDQTLNMLEQLKVEKKMDELTRRLDEMGRQQEQLNEQMEKNTPETSQKMSEQQKKLAEEMKAVEKELQKLAQEMKEKEMKAADKMDQMQKAAEKEQLSEQMKENSDELKMCNNSSCKKKGKNHRRKMAEMANQLQNIKNEMNQSEDQEALAALEKARDQLLDLSMRQEALWKESENLEAGSPQAAQVAEEQENLREALSRVNDDMKQLARESMHASPKLLAAMSEAQAQMQQAARSAAERDQRTASHFRKQAMSALNNALKENQNACSSCKSSCNKPNPNSNCNNAGEMAGQQQKLNMGTRELMQDGQRNPGSLGMGEQASMQRLAVEQEGLAKSARQLAEEAKASQQSLGKLDDIAKEMEEVAQDLRDQNVTQRTLEKQEHIESRLLDYQRANREREFSPKRQSHTGTDIVRMSPQELPDKPGKDQLREDMLRALDAKYTPDFESLIRSYFEALSKWK